MSEKLDLWVEERHRDVVASRFKIKQTLFSGKSEFQTVDIVETYALGKMLLNDGLVMVTEKDEFVYHDMITHVPLFTHPNPKRVLIIGGGDGGTAREVLRHKSVEHCTMIEIDEMVVRACQEHIPQTASVLTGDPRLSLQFDDGVKFVRETQEKFDVILVDSTDPIGPSAPLFGPEFYQDVYRTLSDDGIVVAQGESPFYEVPMQQTLFKIVQNQFSQAHVYNFNNLSYPGGLWSFVYGSKGLHPTHDFQPERVLNSGLEFEYYTKELHTAAFCLPAFMKKSLGLSN